MRRLCTNVETVTTVVVVTGAGVSVVVETVVDVRSGMEMKELQNLVAEALIVGLLRTLRISETTAQVESPRAARSSGLLARGVEDTSGAIEARRAETTMINDFLTAIATLGTALQKMKGKSGFGRSRLWSKMRGRGVIQDSEYILKSTPHLTDLSKVSS